MKREEGVLQSFIRRRSQLQNQTLDEHSTSNLDGPPYGADRVKDLRRGPAGFKTNLLVQHDGTRGGALAIRSKHATRWVNGPKPFESDQPIHPESPSIPEIMEEEVSLTCQ